MTKRTVLLIGALLIIVLLIGLTVYVSQQQQEVRSRAFEDVDTPIDNQSALQSISPTSAACTPPAAVANVRVEYPNCQ